MQKFAQHIVFIRQRILISEKIFLVVNEHCAAVCRDGTVSSSIQSPNKDYSILGSEVIETLSTKMHYFRHWEHNRIIP